MELRFYKNDQGWWVDLPEYIAQGGDPADLAMVCGADDLLDNLAGKTGSFLEDDKHAKITLELVDRKIMSFPTDYSMLKRCDEIPTLSGSYYFDDDTDSLLWLCDVTRWIFNGKFPETIWYKKV